MYIPLVSETENPQKMRDYDLRLFIYWESTIQNVKEVDEPLEYWIIMETKFLFFYMYVFPQFSFPIFLYHKQNLDYDCCQNVQFTMMHQKTAECLASLRSELQSHSIQSDKFSSFLRTRSPSEPLDLEENTDSNFSRFASTQHS